MTGNYVTTGGDNGPLAAGEAIASFGEVIEANAGVNTSGDAPVLTPAFANGTAAQLSDTTRDYMVYLTVTTDGTATTVKIGPTSSADAATIMGSAAATAGQVVSFRLPAGWYVEWAGTDTAFADQSAVGC